MFTDHIERLQRRHLLFAEGGEGGGEGGGGEGEGGGEGVATPPATTYDWAAMRASLPPEMRDSTVLNQFDGDGGGFQGLIKDRITLDPLIGRDKVPLPGKDATPEEMDRFYNQLGRPESAEKYDLGDFAPPEGLPWDAELQTNMMQDLHAAGLSNQQVNQVVRAFANRQNETWQATQQQIAEARTQSENALKSELGTEYDSFIEMAGRAFEQAFGENLDIVAEMVLPDGQQFGNHPLMIRAFGNLARAMGEHGALAPKTGTTGVGMTPDAALAEIEKLELAGSETAKILVTKSHPEHKALKARWRALYEAAHPGVEPPLA